MNCTELKIMTILKNLVVVCNLPFYFSKLSNLLELLIFNFSLFNFLRKNSHFSEKKRENKTSSHDTGEKPVPQSCGPDRIG